MPTLQEPGGSMIRELLLRQEQLEAQNNELRECQVILQQSRDRFAALYQEAQRALRKREELLYERRPMRRARLGLFDQPAILLARHLGSEQFDRKEDRREDIVQIVRDATRERSDALHPLRAQQLGLELLSFGDIRVDVEDGARPPIVFHDEAPRALHENRVPSFRPQSKIAAPLATREQFRARRGKAGGIEA